MMSKNKQKYLMLKNPSEEEVAGLMLLGYVLHSVTPITEEVTKDGRTITYTTAMIYHMVDEYHEEPEEEE